MNGTGTEDNRGELTTPPGSSSYTMHRDEGADPPLLVCQVGRPGSHTDSGRSRTCTPGSWRRVTGCRSVPPTRRRHPPTGPSRPGGAPPDNPVGGWYGMRNGYRGRFGMYLPPLLEALGLAEVTHEARNNSMRGITG